MQNFKGKIFSNTLKTTFPYIQKITFEDFYLKNCNVLQYLDTFNILEIFSPISPCLTFTVT